MIGHGAVEPGGNLVDAQYVDQEGDQLVAARRQILGAGLEGGIVVEQCRIVMRQHSTAGARRRHHGVVTFEGVDHLPRDRPRRGTIAGIVGRLAAADLQGRHLDRAAGVFQQLDRGEAYGRANEIDQTGDEQGDAAGWRRGSRSGHGPNMAALEMPFNDPDRFRRRYRGPFLFATGRR